MPVDPEVKKYQAAYATILLDLEREREHHRMFVSVIKDIVGQHPGYLTRYLRKRILRQVQIDETMHSTIETWRATHEGAEHV